MHRRVTSWYTSAAGFPATGLHCLKSCIDTIAEYLADPHLTHRISSRGGFDEREAAPRHGRGGHCRLL